jgi:hypothetical protein
MLKAIKEKRLATKITRLALRSYRTVHAEKPELSGKGLYREVLLHTQRVDPSKVDEMLDQAEDSVDEWTAPDRDGMGLREVVHFFVMSEFLKAGHGGAVISIGEIVNSLIPGDL